MNDTAHSAYIRYNNQSALVRRWIAMILLRSPISRASSCSPGSTDAHAGIRYLGDQQGQPRGCGIHPRLARLRARALRQRGTSTRATCSRSTRGASRKSMGLNKVELAVLRFACLVNCYKPLEAASELGGKCYSEADLCDLLSSLRDRRSA